MSHNLDSLRQKIDQLDQELLQILAKRFEIVLEVNNYKKAHSLPPLDIKRKQEIETKLELEAKKFGLEPKFALQIFELIHTESIRIQSLKS